MKLANETLHRRNRLFSVILWLMLAFGVAADTAAGLPARMILTLAFGGGAACAVFTVLAYRRILPGHIMYLAPCYSAGLTVYLIVSDPNPIVSTYFLLYVGMTLMTFFNNDKAIIFSGAVSAAATTYLYMNDSIRESIFPNEPLIYLYLYLILATAALTFTARFTAKLQDQIQRDQSDAAAAKAAAEGVLDKLKASILILNEISSKQKVEAADVSSISRDVTDTFTAISQAVGLQSASVVNVTDSIGSTAHDVKNLAARTSDMQVHAAETAELTEEGVRELGRLTEEMERVRAMNDRTVAMMKELSEQNERVTSIIEAISDIAEQTNLLSLNAAIEAARAGEHGKGFAVVSHEVRKLADNARRSTDEISAILSTVRERIEAAHEQTLLGQSAVTASGESVSHAGGIMQRIADTSETVKRYADASRQAAERLDSSYSLIALEMQQIASTVDQNLAAVAGASASMTLQDGKMAELASGFSRLDALVNELKEEAERDAARGAGARSA